MLDTEGERWLWGGIIGGSSIAFVAMALTVVKVCKRYSRNQEAKRIVRGLYSEDENGTVTYIEGNGTRAPGNSPLTPSAPPCDERL